MKAIVLSFLFFSSLAHSAPKQDGYLIQTNLTYQDTNKKEIKTSKDFILPRENKTWVTLTDLKNGVVLLGRMVKADEKSIHMEYLLVDGNVKPNGVISTPSIIANFNEPAEISVGETDKNPNLSVSLVAKKTEFTSDK